MRSNGNEPSTISDFFDLAFTVGSGCMTRASFEVTLLPRASKFRKSEPSICNPCRRPKINRIENQWLHIMRVGGGGGRGGASGAGAGASSNIFLVEPRGAVLGLPSSPDPSMHSHKAHHPRGWSNRSSSLHESLCLLIGHESGRMAELILQFVVLNRAITILVKLGE